MEPLEDIALKSPGKNLELALADVGLENVQTQVRLSASFAQGAALDASARSGALDSPARSEALDSPAQDALLPVRANAGVSLIKREARGIHMSRIFRVLAAHRRAP